MKKVILVLLTLSMPAFAADLPCGIPVGKYIYAGGDPTDAMSSAGEFKSIQKISGGYLLEVDGLLNLDGPILLVDGKTHPSNGVVHNSDDVYMAECVTNGYNISYIAPNGETAMRAEVRALGDKFVSFTVYERDFIDGKETGPLKLRTSEDPYLLQRIEQ